jgi:hypothetical protein
MGSDTPKIVERAVTVHTPGEDLVKHFGFDLRPQPRVGEKLVENPELLLGVRKPSSAC